MMGTDYTASFEAQDIEANKGISLVAYILFFVPLLAVPNSKYARFHANQGLIVFIISIACSIVQNVFWFGSWGNRNGWFFNPFAAVIGAVQVALLACIVYGIINAVNGKAVELPIIGKFRILT